MTPAPTATPPAVTAATEWPTWVLVVVVHGGWLLSAAHAEAMGPGLSHGLLILSACWTMSLQHELLHGHPTRSARFNRLLGLAPWAVWTPYDLYRSSHLAHHRDEVLTEPGADPESNYVSAADFGRHPAWVRAARRAHRTVLGRLVVGPLLAVVPAWLDIVRKPLRGDWSESRAWLTHLLLLAAMLVALDQWAGIGPVEYVLGIAYPALALAMLRSFLEHRPAALPAHRIVINEAGWGWRLLYLNNNYHAVHHAHPSMPWYRLRQAYLADRDGFLTRNGGFLVPGYGHLLRHHAWRPVDSPVHGMPIAQPLAPHDPSLSRSLA